MYSVAEVGPGYMSILPEIPELHEELTVPRIAVFPDPTITEWENPDFEGIPIVCADIYNPATSRSLDFTAPPALLAMFDVVNDPTYSWPKNFYGMSQWCKRVICPQGLLLLTDSISYPSKRKELYPTIDRHLHKAGFTPVYPPSSSFMGTFDVIASRIDYLNALDSTLATNIKRHVHRIFNEFENPTVKLYERPI